MPWKFPFIFLFILRSLIFFFPWLVSIVVRFWASPSFQNERRIIRYIRNADRGLLFLYKKKKQESFVKIKQNFVTRKRKLC